MKRRTGEPWMPAPEYGRSLADQPDQRVPLVGVVGVQHPLAAVAAQHREVAVGVDQLGAEHLALEGQRPLDVAHQQIHAQARERPAVLRRGHPAVSYTHLTLPTSDLV